MAPEQYLGAPEDILQERAELEAQIKEKIDAEERGKVEQAGWLLDSGGGRPELRNIHKALDTLTQVRKKLLKP